MDGYLQIKKTLDATTQLAKNTLQIPLKRHIKSREPHLNHPRLRKLYCTDTMFVRNAAIGGYRCAQVFVGRSSHFAMITESQGESALDDFVRDIGAPYHLKFDNSQMQTGRAWTSILRKYNIASSLFWSGTEIVCQ